MQSMGIHKASSSSSSEKKTMSSSKNLEAKNNSRKPATSSKPVVGKQQVAITNSQTANVTVQPALTTQAKGLPGASCARQLSKLKRFLTTVHTFAVDISVETGDQVKTLILNLANSQTSVEEFHKKIQEATNFPLRPFVIPFIRRTLPLWQQELMIITKFLDNEAAAAAASQAEKDQQHDTNNMLNNFKLFNDLSKYSSSSSSPSNQDSSSFLNYMPFLHEIQQRINQQQN